MQFKKGQLVQIIQESFKKEYGVIDFKIQPRYVNQYIVDDTGNKTNFMRIFENPQMWRAQPADMNWRRGVMMLDDEAKAKVNQVFTTDTNENEPLESKIEHIDSLSHSIGVVINTIRITMAELLTKAWNKLYKNALKEALSVYGKVSFPFTGNNYNPQDQTIVIQVNVDEFLKNFTESEINGSKLNRPENYIGEAAEVIFGRLAKKWENKPHFNVNPKFTPHFSKQHFNRQAKHYIMRIK